MILTVWGKIKKKKNNIQKKMLTQNTLSCEWSHEERWLSLTAH